MLSLPVEREALDAEFGGILGAVQRCGPCRHPDVHGRPCGLEAVSEPTLDQIIEQLQFCIVGARALQLKMLERILSIALLQAHEDKDETENEDDD